MTTHTIEIKNDAYDAWLEVELLDVNSNEFEIKYISNNKYTFFYLWIEKMKTLKYKPKQSPTGRAQTTTLWLRRYECLALNGCMPHVTNNQSADNAQAAQNTAAAPPQTTKAPPRLPPKNKPAAWAVL